MNVYSTHPAKLESSQPQLQKNLSNHISDLCGLITELEIQLGLNFQPQNTSNLVADPIPCQSSLVDQMDSLNFLVEVTNNRLKFVLNNIGALKLSLGA